MLAVASVADDGGDLRRMHHTMRISCARKAHWFVGRAVHVGGCESCGRRWGDMLGAQTWPIELLINSWQSSDAP